MRRGRGASNQEWIKSDELLHKLMALLYAYRGLIRITILKNMALVTHALITFFGGARGGNGWLSQAALSRCMPLGTRPKERAKGLHRFLSNVRLTLEEAYHHFLKILVRSSCGQGMIQWLVLSRCERPLNAQLMLSRLLSEIVLAPPLLR
jgi:hypothetical protein